MKKMDKLLFFSVLILSFFGLLMVYSSSSIWAQYKFHDSFYYFKLQSVFLLIGIFLLYVVSQINYHYYEKYSKWILLGSFCLLILVLIPGIGSIRNGSRSWFGIGPLGIQPSEAAKISLIIFTSKYLSKNSFESHSQISVLFPILMIMLLFFGLIMLQPDLGTGVILVMGVLAILFISGAYLKLFIGGGLLGLVGFILLILIAPYRMKRITSFLYPWKDELGTGFQMIQSLYAIGPSGILGTGFLHSVQKHFYLPEPQTDFIFSIIADEFGIVGAILVLSLYALILYRGIKISISCDDLFGKYLSFGILFQLLFQATMNLMVVVGLIPVTGVTLPFLSYGGSSLIISMFSIGVLLNISKKQC